MIYKTIQKHKKDRATRTPIKLFRLWTFLIKACALNKIFLHFYFDVLSVKFTYIYILMCEINSRENRRANQEQIIQRETGNIGHTRHVTKTNNKNPTQKTKKMSNTEPTKNHNTENYKDEQHGTHQKPQHRKLKR